MKTVIYVGIRRSPLEWELEIEAASKQGYAVRIYSDGDLRHTGLPESRLHRFEPGMSDAEKAAEIVRKAQWTGDLPLAVVSWGDRTAGVAAEVSSALGLRGPGTGGARTCLNKIAQRTALDPYGLSPRWRPGSTADDIRAAVDQLAGPLVFKLAHSSGGRGTALIDKDTDFDDLLKATSLNYVDSDAFVVEEYVAGSEHSVSGVVCDGTVTIFAVADKWLDGDSFVTTTTIVPSALPTAVTDQLAQAAVQAMRAVGLKNGGFHVDMRLAHDGPVVLEIGGRLGGDLINSHLIPLSTDRQLLPYGALISLLAEGLSPAPATFTATAAMLVLPTADPATGPAVARLQAHPQVRAAADWSTTARSAVAAVVESPGPVPLLREELQDWVSQ